MAESISGTLAEKILPDNDEVLMVVGFFRQEIPAARSKRGGRGKIHVFAGGGMGEAEFGGVEEHPIPFLSGAVEAVADDGAAKTIGVGSVEAQLVGAAGEGAELDAGAVAFY